MKPEERARQEIDRRLEAAGWTVQEREQLNLRASLGVAVCDLSLKTGPADYVLFIDAKPVGVIEAKPFGTTLSGVAEQSGSSFTAFIAGP
ncbi:MAG: hypothetical protein FJ006_12365 [Chloroflexi bacterium]|nr:hypothetical protein [Chloroflexota bacterium]